MHDSQGGKRTEREKMITIACSELYRAVENMTHLNQYNRTIAAGVPMGEKATTTTITKTQSCLNNKREFNMFFLCLHSNV